MKINNTFKLIISLIIPQLAGGLGSFFTIGSVKDWYPVLVKPALNPPAWIFGPVWTTLFLLMGYALYLVWKDESGKSKRLAYWAFGIQMVLNTLWSIIFFGLHSPGGALLEMTFLWLAILATIVAFAKISKPAAWLLVPYILWVSFAGYLNYSIWQLNSSAGSGQVACTQEAKLCPDGSYVGRTGPQCEFASCPGENNDLWKATTSNGITFQYPETLLTTYINTQDWPPQVQVLNEPFNCTEAGSETARAGKTEKRLVDDREYCRTSIVEGAAGSIYTQYAYAFPLYSTGSTQADRKRTVILTFTIRATQCDNYDEAERKACEGERETFDLDSVVDRMARSIKF